MKTGEEDVVWIVKEGSFNLNNDRLILFVLTGRRRQPRDGREVAFELELRCWIYPLDCSVECR